MAAHGWSATIAVAVFTRRLANTSPVKASVRVLPNYRLSPFVKHPEHIRDVAQALRGRNSTSPSTADDPTRSSLRGHSAGGHLVTLLATDHQYLKDAGCEPDDIKGVIGISGVYRIPAGNVEVFLGGPSQLALRFDKMAPLRSACKASSSWLPEPLAIPINMNIFGVPFGNDAKAREAASPVCHVKRGLPPFLLLSAENDLPLLPVMANEMHMTLVSHGVRRGWSRYRIAITTRLCLLRWNRVIRRLPPSSTSCAFSAV